MVTLASVLITFVSAWLYVVSTGPAILAAGLVFFFSRVLDCVDGQLARAKGGSKYGRLWDGLADYVAHAAIMVGLIWAYGDGNPTASVVVLSIVSLPAWAWVLISTAALVYQCMLADKFKTEYLTRRFNARQSPSQELREFQTERDAATGLERFLLTILTGYLRLQNPPGREKQQAMENDEARQAYCSMNVSTLFAWNLFGPSMHASFIVLYSVLDCIELYIPTVLIMAIATVPVHLWQILKNRRFREIVLRTSSEEDSK
jgi:phosphatidylglycerophosphate synthase